MSKVPLSGKLPKSSPLFGGTIPKRAARSHLTVKLIDSCITHLKAQEPSRTCNESKEEEEEPRGQERVSLPRETVAACGVVRPCFFFFFTLVTGPRRSLSLKLSDTKSL